MNLRKKLQLAALLVSGLFSLGATEIIIEAEDFKEPGTWQSVNYANATAMMGGKIKGVAKTTFNATPGDYYVFVRAMTHGGGFRHANISVNGLKVGKAGDEKLADGEKGGWRWVPLKRKIHLNAENNTIRMVANSDFTRIDRIIFSTDKNFDCAKAPAPVANPNRQPSARELEGIFGRPKPEGDGPDMLLLAGGRPWVGNADSRHYSQAGYRVMLLNSVYLDGLGGASIKQTPTDPIEPKALDGITPEFKQLNKYKIVAFETMPMACQEKLFTPERIETLKKYVSEGGNVIFTVNVPEKLGDLLPVEKVPSEESMSEESMENLYAERPEGKPFSILPEKWLLHTYFRYCQAKKDARVLSYIVTADGNKLSPYLVEMNYGKGKVMFWNAQYERLQQGMALFNWAYTPVLQGAIAETLYPSEKVNAQNIYYKSLKKQDNAPKPVILDTAEVDLTVPEFGIAPTRTTVTVDGNTATFSNGAKVVVADNKKSISLTFPGAKKPYIREFSLPAIAYPDQADKVDSLETAEAVGTKKKVRASKAKWQIDSVTGGDKLTIKVSADDGSAYTWTIITGEANVDGRKFIGFGQQVSLDTMPKHLLADICFVQKVDVGNKNFRRFACYEPPRGYKDYDMTGKEDNFTRNLGFFSAAQPFSWLEGSDAVFSEFVDTPQSTVLSYTVKKGDDFATGRVNFGFGRVKAPQKTPLFWQMVTDAKYNTSNDWIAMYQFQRKHLRQVANFPEIPAQPNAQNRDTCTNDQQLACMDYAAAHGFKLYALNFCPSPMELFEKPHRCFNDCKVRGLAGYPWFPCCHSPDVTRTVKEHPEWYLKDESGKLTQYFGHFYEGDMNNEEFMKWHKSLIDFMMEQGMKTVWYDMAGAASGGVNFATPESPIGLVPQLKLFRYYYEKGGWVVTEGMNPCVIDGYIFREDVYNKPVGNEFAMIGAQCNGGGFNSPYFRLAMYDVFWPMNMDGVTFNFETGFGVNDLTRHAVSFVPTINEVLSFGMPFIRETPFGTTWIADKGGAFFCWNGVKNLKATLPAGFVADSVFCNGKTTKLNGKLPTSVEPESIIVLKKK